MNNNEKEPLLVNKNADYNSAVSDQVSINDVDDVEVSVERSKSVLAKYRVYLERCGLMRKKKDWMKKYSVKNAQKWECNVKDYIKSVLYGGLDGLTTVFVAVATISTIGSAEDRQLIHLLAIGLAKLLTGALSMGVSDYLATKAQNDLITTERRRELWECDNFLQGEMGEMREIYEEKGLDPEAAEVMVNIMSSNKEAFVDVMMVQELGLPATYDRFAPLKAGIVNGSSFIFFGVLPLVIYIVFTLITIGKKNYKPNMDHIFYIDCGITVLALVMMGLLKSFFHSQFFIIGVFTTVLVGAISGAVGYGVAFGLTKWVGASD